MRVFIRIIFSSIIHELVSCVKLLSVNIGIIDSFSKVLAGKTKDVITNLKSLAQDEAGENEGKITIETIKSRNFSAVMQNFLFNLALAENLVES